MIDTVDIYSCPISEALAAELELHAVKKQATHKINGSDLVLYEFLVVPYQNTYTNKINIAVSREKWIYNSLKKVAEKIKTEPYIKISGSLHKFFLGHNVFGGSSELKYQIQYLLFSIENDLELENNLPSIDKWYITRIDYAKIYLLNNQNEVQSYFNSLRNVQYPRKGILYREGESVYKGGRYTSIKIYNKYAEFKKHDYKTWKKYSHEGDELLRFAERVIRIEVEVKLNKLKYDFNKNVFKIDDIKIEYLESVLSVELKRLLNEGEEDMKIKNNAQIRMILQNNLSSEQFIKVYGFYNDLCLNGKKVVRSAMPKSTFYKYLGILKKYNINYINHDVIISDTIMFNPLTAISYDKDLIAVNM